MKLFATLLVAGLALAGRAVAQDAEPPTPASVVAAAKADEWTAIDPADLLVMQLAPDAHGKPRTVVIQLLPPPFSQGWVGNIRTLAKAHWWDGTSVYRVVDNWVAQWGDGEDDQADAKPLPDGLRVVPESEYVTQAEHLIIGTEPIVHTPDVRLIVREDLYAPGTGFAWGWPVAFVDGHGHFSARDLKKEPQSSISAVWSTHCYGTVGVARDLSPDTGTGAELYAVIGHAPRQLDRNIAVVGRVIEGIEHLSTLPRGTADAGVYATEAEHTPIVSVRLGNELPDPPKFEYLASDSASFADYVRVRANRQDAFYQVPAHGIDVCNVQVPIRRMSAR